jgi:hypothetical protein
MIMSFCQTEHVVSPTITFEDFAISIKLGVNP